MKCYICKKEINISMRVFMAPKNKREKHRYRDLCKKCYASDKESKGYVLENGVWKNKNRRIYNVNT